MVGLASSPGCRDFWSVARRWSPATSLFMPEQSGTEDFNNAFTKGNIMATNVVSQELDAIALEVQVAAPPDRVFQAITDPSQMLRWWGQQGIYHSTKWSTDVRPGGHWRCEGVSDTDGSAYDVTG